MCLVFVLFLNIEVAFEVVGSAEVSEGLVFKHVSSLVDQTIHREFT